MSLSIWLDWSQWESPYVQLNECPYQSDLEQPYGNGPMVSWECPYQNDLNEPYENVPIKMIRFDWIEVNRTIWGDMSELKEVSWNNPMGISLWSEEGEPYESDLSEPNGNLPMSWEWMSLSKWLEWSQWESPYQNDQIWMNRGKISE